MRRKIPSTTSLVVFETAARHESFARAATELCLTESAVSRQISALETFVGRKLFSRVKRHVTLTEAGRFYAAQIGPHLDLLEKKTQAVREHRSDSSVLDLAAIPTFARLWLLPKLKSFYVKHPGITVNISARLEPFSFDEHDFDAAIHYTHPAWAGSDVEELFAEDLVPVLSARHFDAGDIRTPGDVRKVPLLHNARKTDAWNRWFSLSEQAAPPAPAGPKFDLYSLMLDGVKDGFGAGLVPRIYVAEELAQGALFSPSPYALRNEKTYCLVYPKDREISPPLEAFASWLNDVALSQAH